MSLLPLLLNRNRSNRPTLNLEFTANPVPASVTFTRATTRTRINSAGALETVAINTPAIDYDPVTLACRGLSIWEARTNLLTYSQDFSNAAWTKNAPLAVGAANSTIAPDGILSGDTLSTTNAGSFYQDKTAAGTSTLTSSIYFHTSSTCTRTVLCLFWLGSSTQSVRVTLDPSTGAYVSSSESGATNLAYSINSVGGGWYRVTITGTGTDGANTFARYQVYDSVVTPNTLVAWGAQLEAGSSASPYIPTTTAQVTRAADVAVISGANFSNFYNQSKGTFVVEFDSASPTSAGYNRVFEVSDASFNVNCMILLQNNGVGNVYTAVNVSSVAQSILYTTALTANVAAKVAFSYGANDFAQSSNGAVVVTYTIGSVPTVDRLRIGTDNVGTSQLNGHIKRLTYYPTRLTNAQLVALST